MDVFTIKLDAKYRLPSGPKIPPDAIEELRALLIPLSSDVFHVLPDYNAPDEIRVELPALLESERTDLTKRRERRYDVQKLVSDACKESALEYSWFAVDWPAEWG